MKSSVCEWIFAVICGIVAILLNKNFGSVVDDDKREENIRDEINIVTEKRRRFCRRLVNLICFGIFDVFLRVGVFLYKFVNFF